MKIGFMQVANFLAVLGFIASLVSVILIWVRHGSPIMEDVNFAAQPLFFLGLTFLFLVSICLDAVGKKQKGGQ